MRMIYTTTRFSDHVSSVKHLRVLGACLLVVNVIFADHTIAETARPLRLIYNSDADNMFIYVKPPMRPADVYAYVDEIAAAGVTTIYMCPNYGMPVNYPSDVTQMFGTGLTAEQDEHVAKVAPEKSSLERGAANLRSLVAAGHSPLGLVIDRARVKGLETFITFRPNEVHWIDKPDDFPINLLLSKYWREHPQWRIGKAGDAIGQLHRDILGPRTSPVVAGWLPGGMNFAVPEVRAQRLAQLRECCERFNIDGLDIDFQRFPMYFRIGEEAANIKTMTAWIAEVRKMTKEVARKRGQPILLSVRVMAKPQQNLGLGLDPVDWARKGMIDIVVASHYLHNNFPLPIGEYRELLPNDVPLYGSIEVEASADNYRRIAKRMWDDGVDGIMMFNFFTCRELGTEPEFGLLKELGDPSQLKADDTKPDEGD
ncbi:hypothetical protein CA54_60690 [Symmachiella macrocystis]|uniref:Glycosyl hydrolase-like 10 domain-containing protein n=1 Tax=Symmachiella macrocystis TaxID=2527985 RepID=A0A5C6AXF2_9PLAN|nr:glycoside hydrolase family 18 protein [Symmachiella macrocystis]TWU04187.1 hypothetical protein CA54_60690 [Symmachiella macrocystis]